MPWTAHRPLMRLTCWTRSLIRRSRSRCSRRSSSSVTLGTRTTLHTFGSPRRYAISERSNRSVSIRSVFTRRGPPVHLQARRVNDVIAYAVRFELPVQPETIVAGLVARDHFDRPTRLAADTCPHLLDQLE